MNLHSMTLYKNMASPVCVLILSGKRKSGKDYVTDILHERLGVGSCSVLRLSGPLKMQYAKEHGLDFDKLLDASDYKEKYRADMIRWGEEKRNADPGYFCRLISQGPGSEKPVWIISDARRKTDINYFTTHYEKQLIRLRIEATDETRQNRGWVFTQGVDDAESECGLDTGLAWDFIVHNNDNSAELEKTIEQILETIKAKTNIS